MASTDSDSDTDADAGAATSEGGGSGSGNGDYTVRLEHDGPTSWSNAGRLFASQDAPLLTGLDEAQAHRLVDEHPFEHEDAGDSGPSGAADTGDLDGEAEAEAEVESGGDSDDSDSESAGDDGSEDTSDEIPDEYDGLEDLTGVGPARADDLRAGGYDDLSSLRNASAADIASIDGVSEDLAESIHDQLHGNEASDENGE
jgi:predicted flap endonuclease-1-like 5' DNA nuclease